MAICLLTAMGVPPMPPWSCRSPILAVAEAVKRGKEIGECYGTDYSQWRSVITIMMARFEEREVMAEQAREQGFELTEDLMRWSGTAIMKKGYHLLREREYPSKLLLASSRVGPGKEQIRHVEETAGANLVYTMNPKFIQNVLPIHADKEFEPRIDKPVPSEVMENCWPSLLPPGYEENGLKQEEFLQHPGTVFTRRIFQGHECLEEFVAGRMKG